jgi:hypothetical protein
LAVRPFSTQVLTVLKGSLDLIPNYWTWLKRPVKDKHTSLVVLSASNEEFFGTMTFESIWYKYDEQLKPLLNAKAESTTKKINICHGQLLPP